MTCWATWSGRWTREATARPSGPGRSRVMLALLGEVLAAGLAAAFLAAAFSRLEPRASAVFLVFVVLGHAALLALTPASPVVANTAVLASSSAVGVAVARLAPSRSKLLALGVAASVADAAWYGAGLTPRLLDGGGAAREWGALHYLAVSVPVRGGALPVVGWGDLVMVAAFYAALRGLGSGVWGAAGPPVLGLVVALGIGLGRGSAVAVALMTSAVMVYLAIAGRRGETRPATGTYEHLDGNPNREST